jgi:CDP-glucose 4,6-dehydratase
VPDSIRAWSEGRDVEIRSPYATRPWQHVLEPLSGYLLVGSELYRQNRAVKNEAFNFGPESKVNKTVEQLLTEMGKTWSSVKWHATGDQGRMKEAGLLKLCCDKAHHTLDWYPTLTFEETVAFTVKWYKTFYETGLRGEELYGYTLSQIGDYIDKAEVRERVWIG